MSDTPITDFEKQTLEEWVKEYDGLMIPEEDKKPWYLVHEVTVKKLERERDEALEEVRKLKIILDYIKKKSNE